MEIGTEAEQFPEKEYIKGFFVAVYSIKKFAIIHNKTIVFCLCVFKNIVIVKNSILEEYRLSFTPPTYWMKM